MASAECSSPRHQIRRRRTIHKNESKEKNNKLMRCCLFKQSHCAFSLFYYRFFVIPNGWKIGYIITIIIIIIEKTLTKSVVAVLADCIWINNKTLFFIVHTHKINIDTLHAGCTPQVNSAEHTVRDVMKIIIIYCYPLGLSYKLLYCSNNHYSFKLMSGIILY